MQAAWSVLTSAASKSQSARRTFSSEGIHYRRAFSSRNTLSRYVQEYITYAVRSIGSRRRFGQRFATWSVVHRGSRHPVVQNHLGAEISISQPWGQISRPLGGKYLHIGQGSPTWASFHISDFGQNRLQLKGRFGFLQVFLAIRP